MNYREIERSGNVVTLDTNSHLGNLSRGFNWKSVTKETIVVLRGWPESHLKPVGAIYESFDTQF